MVQQIRAVVILCALAAVGSGCGGGDSTDGPGFGCDGDLPPSRTISCIDSFRPGGSAGFGQDRLPEVIYGEPRGGGLEQGSLDVLSLGDAGEITVGFGNNEIIDGDGIDFIIFENAFYVSGDPAFPFKELGEVSVSEDGESFTTFPCAADSLPYDGCAGWRPVLANPDKGISAFDPDVAGGDPFDLATIGVSRARFVRIRDISGNVSAPNGGFDLDAIAIVHARVP